VGRWLPSDHFSRRFAVSVKGVCVINGKVILLRTEQQEWDLPGGKLGWGESLETALQREVSEELGITVVVQHIVAATRRRIRQSFPITVVVLIYRCHTLATEADIQISSEHTAYGLFHPSELTELHLPSGYLSAIHDCFAND